MRTRNTLPMNRVEANERRRPRTTKLWLCLHKRVDTSRGRVHGDVDDQRRQQKQQQQQQQQFPRHDPVQSRLSVVLVLICFVLSVCVSLSVCVCASLLLGSAVVLERGTVHVDKGTKRTEHQGVVVIAPKHAHHGSCCQREKEKERKSGWRRTL